MHMCVKTTGMVQRCSMTGLTEAALLLTGASAEIETAVSKYLCPSK